MSQYKGTFEEMQKEEIEVIVEKDKSELETEEASIIKTVDVSTEKTVFLNVNQNIIVQEPENNGKWYSVSSYEEASSLIRDYEIDTVTKFSVFYKDTKDFGKANVYSTKHRVKWNDEGLDFDGVPFVVCGSKIILDCQHGQDRKKVFKEKMKDVNSIKMQSDHAFIRTNLCLQNTKKFGCKAQI